MKIEDLISDTNNHKEINIGGASIPVLALKKFIKDRLYPFEAIQGKQNYRLVWKKLCRMFYVKATAGDEVI